jgi:hypothetical protein
VSVQTLCSLFGKSSQAYYKKKAMLLSREQVKEVILDAVSYYRSKAPGMGALKLYV